VLEERGFGVQALHDAGATHAGILDAAAELVRGARAGDVIVFQYAGHGTRVPDYDGDESDQMDEAYVPIDYGDGAFLVDDDLRAVFAELREGVNLTCFVDCCHSATITRILARRADARSRGRARFLTPAAAALAAHERFRASLAGRPGGEQARDRSSAVRWVTFSACQATEEALEYDGQGDFTRHALAILGAGDADAFTHGAFQRRLVDAFGPDRRQTPHLDCPHGWEELPLLAALHRMSGPALDAARGGNGTRNGHPAGRVRQIAEDLLDVAAQLHG
ncbi:MAG TPA: caspase family protein, partial [Gemmatimonadaceae bacterium]|nr:caspase family protein [Gemmatimonadaceae bacterium]